MAIGIGNHSSPAPLGVRSRQHHRAGLRAQSCECRVDRRYSKANSGTQSGRASGGKRVNLENPAEHLGRKMLGPVAVAMLGKF